MLRPLAVLASLAVSTPATSCATNPEPTSEPRPNSAGPVVLESVVPGNVTVGDDEARRTDPTSASSPAATPPRPKRPLRAIGWPDGAPKRRATVKLQLVVGRDGQVTKVKVLESAGAVFAQAAIAYCRTLEFSPGMVDGHAVAMPIRWVVQFEPGED